MLQCNGDATMQWRISLILRQKWSNSKNLINDNNNLAYIYGKKAQQTFKIIIYTRTELLRTSFCIYHIAQMSDIYLV